MFTAYRKVFPGQSRRYGRTVKGRRGETRLFEPDKNPVRRRLSAA